MTFHKYLKHSIIKNTRNAPSVTGFWKSFSKRCDLIDNVNDNVFSTSTKELVFKYKVISTSIIWHQKTKQEINISTTLDFCFYL